jgi:hypothetical protein
VPPVTFRNAAKIVPLVDKTFLAIRENRLEEESILNLGRIVYLGMAKPEGITEEMFLSWQVPLMEMTDAALVVAAQANMKAAPPPEEGVAIVAPGEGAGAMSPQSPSTSTN